MKRTVKLVFISEEEWATVLEAMRRRKEIASPDAPFNSIPRTRLPKSPRSAANSWTGRQRNRSP